MLKTCVSKHTYNDRKPNYELLSREVRKHSFVNEECPLMIASADGRIIYIVQ
jgi:hypothetical protein